MVMWNWGLIEGAAAGKDDAALHILSLVAYFGYSGMGIGVAAALLATGLAGLSNAALPRWFAIITLVMGVLGALGTAGIPPGGLVNYVLLPFWLIATAIILARAQQTPDASTPIPRDPTDTVNADLRRRTDIPDQDARAQCRPARRPSCRCTPPPVVTPHETRLGGPASLRGSAQSGQLVRGSAPRSASPEAATSSSVTAEKGRTSTESTSMTQPAVAYLHQPGVGSKVGSRP